MALEFQILIINFESPRLSLFKSYLYTNVDGGPKQVGL